MRGPGQPKIPADIVESTLLAILADPIKHEVVLTFRMYEHQFALRADGVDHLLVNEFIQNNIVHEVRILDQDSDAENVRDVLASLLFDSESAAEVTEAAFLSKLERCALAVLEGRQILVEVEPVYGSSVLLLADKIEWVDS